MAQLLTCWCAELLIKEETTLHQPVDQTNLKGSNQNDKEGRSGCCFIPNNPCLNENHAHQKQHECNDSNPERRGWTPFAPWPDCGEHVH